jgi:hypothetical protein
MGENAGPGYGSWFGWGVLVRVYVLSNDEYYAKINMIFKQSKK